SPDAALAEVIRSAPEVVQGLVMYNHASLEKLGPARKFLLTSLAGRTPGSTVEGVPLEKVRILRFHSAEMPLQPFVDAGVRAGFFNIVPDADGTIRRMPPLARLDAAGGVLLSLEVETAAAYHGTRAELVYDRNLNQVTSVRLRARGGGTLTVPLQLGEPYTFINHLGDRSVFKALSFADVVEGNFDPAAVRGKAVLIGVTQIANFDQRVTPFSEFEAGIFTHASFLSNILDQSFLRRPAELAIIELAFIIGSALALGFVLPRVKFRWKLVSIALALGGWLAFDQLMFSNGLHLATFLPSVNVLATSFAVIFFGYLTADTERQSLAKAFQYRVGEKVMREMMAHPEKFKQGGERREMTVLFSDIRGFTSLAERMSPEELTKFMNEYLTPMTEIVFEEDGTLDKYIGDAVMAFWGAPIDQQDHAARACSTALKMVQRLEALKVEWRAKGRPDFDIGVGINSGPMSVGFMGSTVRGDYTVMGDAVNLASRLEGTNKEYETRVLISEGTWTQVKDRFVARRLGAVRVKGKRRPVGIYELRGSGRAQGSEAEAISAFEEALSLYSARQFDEAEQRFRRVLILWPEDPPTQRYLEELEAFRASPPGPAWDGVYTATTK
ncbi:MAG: adenylate/guanylate cyclase domain-containing protein, partial [Myxococcaceae bacterium]